MEFSQRNSEDPLILLQMPKTVCSEIDTFPDSHPCCSKEQQGSVREVRVFAEFLIQETIVLGRERFREIRIEGRKVLRDNEVLFA